MRSAAVALLALLNLSACRSAEQPALATDFPAPEWSRTSVIYEINVRQFTPEGTFAALERHLPRLDSLGVDVLWLMPVQPIGVENRKGGLGSYYSIANYTAINPEFGTEADARSFIGAAHRHGMKVVLDWVANHTAFDHPWITENPDWYERRADGTIMVARDNEGRETDWTDVAELNYDNQDMRRAMIADLRWWVERMGIDGFRMDVAGGVPMEFWRDAHRELRTVRPDLLMIAEAEGAAYHDVFHVTYGWELHHLLNAIAKGEQPASRLHDYFAKQADEYPAHAYRMYFTSNHDENSWAGTEFERMGANHVPAFVLSATVQNSFPLLYTGQEASLSRRLRFFEKDTVDWSGDSLADFYRSIFELKRANPALWNGAAGGMHRPLTTNGGDALYAFTRSSRDNTVLVATNFAAAPVTVSYEGLVPAGGYTDWFTKETVAMPTDGVLEVPANGYRILVRGGERR